MSPDGYVLDPVVRALLVDLGVSPPRVLNRASLPADTFARGPVSLPPQQYHAFWTALQQESGDANLPISIARALRVEIFQPPVFAALCSPTLDVAADRIAAHKRLIGPMRVTIDRSSTGLRITPRWPPGVAPPDPFVLWELVFWVALARIGTRTDVHPVRVTAPAPPADREAYRDYLGVPVQRGAVAAVSFSRLDAERPFLTADEGMWRFFEPELRRRLSELDEQACVTDRVRAVLLEQLPAGDATMQTAARSLAMSTRTLQRRLSQERTTFQSVLKSTRESLARHYLEKSSLPAAEISFLLGYEDATSFYRAFHGWTGQTPQRVRAGSG
jgi:AraC-like DNA-binding protein